MADFPHPLPPFYLATWPHWPPCSSSNMPVIFWLRTSALAVLSPGIFFLQNSSGLAPSPDSNLYSHIPFSEKSSLTTQFKSPPMISALILPVELMTSAILCFIVYSLSISPPRMMLASRGQIFFFFCLLLNHQLSDEKQCLEHNRYWGEKNIAIKRINCVSHQKTKEKHTLNIYPYTILKPWWLHTSKMKVQFIVGLKEVLRDILHTEGKFYQREIWNVISKGKAT